MSTETQSPFSSKGVRIHWNEIMRAIAWLVPVLLCIAMLYLSSVFAKQEDLIPFKDLPARVDKLEDFKTEQKQNQTNTSAAVNSIQQDGAAMKAEIRALREESTRNTDRILQRLDKLQSR